MRIPSGVTDQVIYFVAVDSTDLKTRETGLSSFTVYRSRNGGTATAMTTPTVTEVDGTNMPGVYKLLLDEDMTIDSGDDSQEMVFHITQASMAPVTRVIELYRPKITAGYTLGVGSDGDLLEVNTLTNHTVQSGDSYARLGAPAGASIAADIAALPTDADVNAQCDLALSDYDPPTHAEVTTAFTEIKGTTWSSATDTLEHIRDKETDIETDTAEIGAAGAGLTVLATAANLATVDTVVDGIQTDLDNATDGLGALKAAIDAVPNASEINAEVVDALATDTYGEPGQGSPAATTSLAAKINYLYKSWRNKKDNDGSTTQLYDDAGTTVDQKQATSEAGGTVTKAEWISGP